MKLGMPKRQADPFVMRERPEDDVGLFRTLAPKLLQSGTISVRGVIGRHRFSAERAVRDFGDLHSRRRVGETDVRAHRARGQRQIRKACRRLQLFDGAVEQRAIQSVSRNWVGFGARRHAVGRRLDPQQIPNIRALN